MRTVISTSAALPKPRVHRPLLVAAWLAGAALLCALAWQLSLQRASTALATKAERHAAGLAADLGQALEKYETLPFVISLQANAAQPDTDEQAAA